VSRTLFLCAVLTAVPLPARADQTMTDTETVIRLNVQAMPAPKPALRYLLLPDLKEMQPGNPIENYLKCILDQDFSSQIETLRPSALRQADRAARMDKPDWQIQLKLKTDGVGLLCAPVGKNALTERALRETSSPLAPVLNGPSEPSGWVTEVWSFRSWLYPEQNCLRNQCSRCC
jgi:hypothetical protein